MSSNTTEIDFTFDPFAGNKLKYQQSFTEENPCLNFGTFPYARNKYSAPLSTLRLHTTLTSDFFPFIRFVFLLKLYSCLLIKQLSISNVLISRLLRASSCFVHHSFFSLYVCRFSLSLLGNFFCFFSTLIFFYILHLISRHIPTPRCFVIT